MGGLVLALACGSLSAQAVPAAPGSAAGRSAGTASASPSPGTSGSAESGSATKGASGAAKGSGDDDAKKKAASTSAGEPTTEHPIYAYDAADRLVGVTDPDGETARYRYDEVGNRLGIDRYPSTDLSVLSVVPARAAVGAEVTLSGTGFSATAAEDTVSFGDARATVTSASVTRLKVTVPPGATGGKVTVAVGQDTADSTESFTVSAGEPVVSGMTPSSGVPGTQVVLTGSGFATNSTDNVVRFNGGAAAQVVSVTSTSLTVLVPVGATTGRVEASTPEGRTESDDDFTVPLAGESFETTVRTSVTDDAPPSVAVTQNGNKARVLFDADRGDDIDFGFTKSTLKTSLSELLKPGMGMCHWAACLGSKA